MSYSNCQNPKCHYYDTKDRIRGIKPNKVYTTRKATHYFGIACTLHCLNEFWQHNAEQIQRAIPEISFQSRPIDTYYHWSSGELRKLENS